MADEIMDSEARERLIRLETINNEQNRRLDRVLELAETMARMQEREIARDGKIELLFKKYEAYDAKIDELKRAKNWGAGVIAVIVAVILPVAGFAILDSHTLIASIDRRLIHLEAYSNYPRATQ